MISYSTQFPICISLTKQKFIESVILWNQGSRYNKFDTLAWNKQDYSFTVQESDKSLSFEDLPNLNIIASRFVKTDEHGIWKTDFILNMEDELLSIKVTHETTEFTTDFAPTYYPPFFVKMMIRDGYAGNDAGIAVTREPIHLDAKNVALAKNIAEHSIKTILPSVLVSRTSSGDLPIDIDDLAIQLQGVAHVIDEGETSAISKLAVCEGVVKPGQIYVVFPNKNARTKTFNIAGDIAENPALIRTRIISEIYNYCNHSVRREQDTWEGIQNEKLRIAQKKIKEENQDLYQVFGDELSEFEKLNSDLTRENQRLLAENQMLRLQLAAKEQVPLLYMGEERDFYSGEIREIVLDILNDYKKNSQELCRRADIVLDILENNEFDHTPARRREQVKTILKGYRTLSGSLKSQLESLGFKITEDGKHYKWTYYGDNRYMVTASKTGSDERAGKNLAAEINKTML